MSNNPRPFMWNKTGPFCNVAFTARGSDYLALIPRDMSVDESLHDYYFAARNSYVMALEAFGAHGIAPQVMQAYRERVRDFVIRVTLQVLAPVNAVPA